MQIHDGYTEDVRGYLILKKKLYTFYRSWMDPLRKHLQAYSVNFASHGIKYQPKCDATYMPSGSSTNPSTCSTTALTTTPQILLPYPVNPLEEVMASYLLSIQPFFKPDEFKKEKKQSMDFFNTAGNELQKLLTNAGNQEVNWLTNRWTNSIFLSKRTPVTVFSNPCIAFPLQKFDSNHDFLQFTSQAIYAICELMKLVEHDQLPVSTWKSFDLDNSQLHNVFGSVRIPCISCDIVQQFITNYVIVIYRNNVSFLGRAVSRTSLCDILQFYKLDVVNAEGKLRSVPHLFQALSHIVNIGSAKGIEIGLLTHEPRDTWAAAHNSLVMRKSNRQAIECIEKSLFTVSLDQPIKVSNKSLKQTIMAAQLLHGGCLIENSANRWMDKPLQLIVNPNGMAGFCCECSPADTQAFSLIMDYVQKQM